MPTAMRLTTTLTLACACLAAATTLAGCGSETDVPEDVEILAQAIWNGTPVADANNVAQNPATVAVYHNWIRPCSGTLIRRQWVLSARHCFVVPGSADQVFGPLIPVTDIRVIRATSPGLTPPATGTSVATRLIVAAGVDLALVRISPEIANPAGLWNGDGPMLNGQTVRVMGYGRNVDGGNTEVENGTTGAGTLRQADVPVMGTVAAGAPTFSLNHNSSNQLTWHGDSGGPAYRLTDRFGRNIPGVAGINRTSGGGLSIATDVLVPTYRSFIKRRTLAPGDFDDNGMADIVLTQGFNWGSIPVAHSTGSGFNVTNNAVSNFPVWAQTSGVKVVPGDFNGDGRADLALTGPASWGTIPIAFSLGAGTFNVTNFGAPGAFAQLAATAGVKAVPGDFNGDGRGDIALTGPSGWTSIPMALSNGDGTFTFVNQVSASFPGWAALSGARPNGGDFDGDGRDDIALTGAANLGAVPVAFSNGDGTFRSTVVALTDFPTWSQATGAKTVAGDFNGDGRDDLALIGGPGWGTIPIAFSVGNGAFTVSNQGVADFPFWGQVAGAQPVTGDFNGDIWDDIALTGGAGWGTVPVAFSLGNGTFSVINPGVANFPIYATQAGARAYSGH